MSTAFVIGTSIGLYQFSFRNCETQTDLLSSYYSMGFTESLKIQVRRSARKLLIYILQIKDKLNNEIRQIFEKIDDDPLDPNDAKNLAIPFRLAFYSPHLVARRTKVECFKLLTTLYTRSKQAEFQKYFFVKISFVLND